MEKQTRDMASKNLSRLLPAAVLALSLSACVTATQQLTPEQTVYLQKVSRAPLTFIITAREVARARIRAQLQAHGIWCLLAPIAIERLFANTLRANCSP